MSGSTLAYDGQLEGTSEILDPMRSFSLDSPSPTLVGEPEEDLEPNPFESIASDMLAIVSDLQEALSTIERGPSISDAEKNKSADDSVSPSPNSISGESSGVRRFWPFKGSLPLVKSTSAPPNSDPETEHLAEAWRWLLDASLDSINRAVAAHVVLETAAEVNHHRPPLFWLLFSGHRALQTLRDSVQNDGTPSPLDKWNPPPLLQWCSDAKRLFEKHGLADDQESLPRDLSEYCNASTSKTNKLLHLLPPSLIHRPKHGAPFCDSGDFAIWSMSNIPAGDEKHVGRLQELYLFRSKKAPFHHEFLVAGFGDEAQEMTSWIRMERGARMRGGSSGPMTGMQSSGPLLGGVGARETISFSESKAALCDNANELAKIVLAAPATFPIFIVAMTHQAQSTSNSNGKYQLFTTNCRWYSRRTFLNILQWCDVAHIPALPTWKGTETTLEFIQKKLEKERFGGSKLVDLRAKGLDHRNLLALATARQESIPLSRAVLDPLLESLMTTRLDPDERAVLIADLLTKRSHVIVNEDLPQALEDAERAVQLMRDLPETAFRREEREKDSILMMMSRSHVIVNEDLPQALEDAERAVQLMRDLPETAFRREEQLVWSLGALATALRTGGRFEEAIPVLRECLELDHPSLPFAIRLCELGLNYQRSGQIDEAIEAFRDSANVLARIDQGQSWSYSRRNQVNVLVMLAKMLESVDRDAEAVSVRQEIVSIRRDFPAKDEDGDDLLILALINLATCATSAGEYATSLQASKEAIRLCKSDASNANLLPMAMALSAQASYGLGDVKSALRDITAAIDEQSTTLDDSCSIITRGAWFKMRSTYLLETGDVLQGLEDLEAAIPFYESACALSDGDPGLENKLWTVHFTRASLLKDLERVEDAADAFRKAADIRRPAVEADPDISEERFMELIFTLEACAMALRELDRPEEVRECADESITRLRLRRQSTDCSTLVSETLRSALLRHSELMARLGDEQEALSLANESVEICELLGDPEHHIGALLHRLLQEVANGYFERAIATAEESLELCETRLSDRLDLRSTALTSYARALNDAERYADAAEKQEGSLALFREVADFTSLDARISLAQRLAKLSEYYQDAGLFEQALVSVNEAVEHHRTLYEEGDNDGMTYCQTLARKASILFSLNERKQARYILDEELELLKIVLDGMSVDDILAQADQRHHEALMLTVKGKSADALDSARQHVVLTRLAWSIEPRYTMADKESEGDADGDGEAQPKSVLEQALIGLGMIATMNNSRIDAMAAMLEAFKLSHDVDLDIDEVVMQKALEDMAEEDSN
ncbi:TPR-like protein [Clavulina sp. PMI_390]|nr:TPR-like protein [Clavulina sp. PMI_390]